MMFWLFGHKACGILAPHSGTKPSPPPLEGEVLTTGRPGKSPSVVPNPPTPFFCFCFFVFVFVFFIKNKCSIAFPFLSIMK